ncbi:MULTISPECIES: pitrilysin family protein [Fusobacterium]|jgi:predicted Zn-dependent peptidase|uniref:Insulinase family protein n=1 Tax=Fusobacterium hominis TaxID=2764326 RepID=A0A7G9GX45_9FUSO|nr:MULTISPECIES: pitrilysin family protein [Fusobacterium]QNM15377.1 insulinase family protein [Fusobacterium hominis]
MSIEIRKLKNGIPVLINNIESVNTISMGVYVKTGARNEYSYESGVSHFIEHMMFKGTTTRTAKQISEEIDNEGGIINAYTSRDTTCYYIKMLASKIDKGIEILTDMFLNSTFTQENLERERNVIIEEIRMYDDIPEEVVHDENIRFALTGPQSNSVSGTIDSVKGITRDIFLKYYNEQYRASNMVISIVGKMDVEKIFNDLNEGFGKIEDKEVTRFIDPTYKINSGEKIIKKDTNQVHLCFNSKGVGLLDKNKYPAAIISSVLGGNMSSRLFQKIREEKGLAYSVYTYSTAFIEDGVFTVYAGTTKESYKEVLEIIKTELSDIKENGITAYELQKSKNQFLSLLTFALEGTKEKMERMANSYLTYDRVIEIDEIIKLIEKITLEDIKDVAKMIFDEKYYSWTVLGDIE